MHNQPFRDKPAPYNFPDLTPQDVDEIEAVEDIPVAAPKTVPVTVPKPDFVDIRTIDIPATGAAGAVGNTQVSEDIDGVVITVRANGANGNDSIRFALGGYANRSDRMEIAPRQVFSIPTVTQIVSWDNPTANAHVATIVFWRGKRPEIY